MSTSERSRREKMLAHETDVYEQWFALRSKYGHIFDSPNSVRAEHTLKKILQQSVPGKCVLEIGCGSSRYTVQLTNFGASYVLGTDISKRRIALAKQSELSDLRDYTVADLSEPFEGYFDVIVGGAILHHLNYQEVMQRLSSDNLREHGLMLFYQPLASNWLMGLFRRVSRNVHTLDELAFYRRDMTWMWKTFPEFTMIPVNYLSLALGVVTSFLFENLNNLLLRFADRVDSLLARHFPWLHPQFRLAIFNNPQALKMQYYLERLT